MYGVRLVQDDYTIPWKSRDVPWNFPYVIYSTLLGWEYSLEFWTMLTPHCSLKLQYSTLIGLDMAFFRAFYGTVDILNGFCGIWQMYGIFLIQNEYDIFHRKFVWRSVRQRSWKLRVMCTHARTAPRLNFFPHPKNALQTWTYRSIVACTGTKHEAKSMHKTP